MTEIDPSIGSLSNNFDPGWQDCRSLVTGLNAAHRIAVNLLARYTRYKPRIQADAQAWRSIKSQSQYLYGFSK